MEKWKLIRTKLLKILSSTSNETLISFTRLLADKIKCMIEEDILQFDKCDSDSQVQSTFRRDVVLVEGVGWPVHN